MLRQYRSLLFAAVVAAPFLVMGVAGCSTAEEKSPPGYYTGPMNPKGSSTTVTEDQGPAAGGRPGGANPKAGGGAAKPGMR